jgi:hypothetical protein
MTNSPNKMSLRTAALLAGIAYLMMMATPFAEFYVFPKLIVPGNFVETAKNIIANEALFRFGIAGYLVNFIGDMLAAWALYILLKPVNENLSLFTAWFRLVYTIVSLAALLNLVTILQLLHSAGGPAIFNADQTYAQVELSLRAFRSGWSFAYIFFGIHLWLLGYLVYRSGYIPRIIGVLLIIAGSGWLIDNIRPYLFPGLTINFTIIMVAGLGELVFMFWLLIRGSKIKETNQNQMSQ